MIEKYLKKKISRVDLETRMLTGSLQGQYDKLLPRNKQDSLATVKIRKQDSLDKIKKSKDTLTKKSGGK
jgi:penicillin-binding protein 2